MKKMQIKLKIVGIIVVLLITISILLVKIKKEKNIQETFVSIVNQEEKLEEQVPQKEFDVNVSEIISNNINNKIKEVIEKQEVELEYETEYQNNSNLPKGIIQVLQQGQDGIQEIIIKKKYEGEELISDEQVGRKIIKPSVNRIVEVGTANRYNNYKIKVGDIVYATPYELEIREKADKGAEVLIKINKDSKLQIKSKKGNWYYIIYGTYFGWVEADCVTHLVPNNITFNDNKNELSKNVLIKKLNKKMDLSKPSGLSLEQFEKILKNEDKDKNCIFSENAKYFYYIENSYGINGVFVAAIGIHESNWGTSKIATNKKNLFGYGAYDLTSYSSAYSYNDYSASIDMIARVLVKHYLNPKGTSIYNGEVATGRYYNGKTLSAVNKKYATDKKWADGVYSWMNYLYNKL